MHKCLLFILFLFLTTYSIVPQWSMSSDLGGTFATIETISLPLIPQILPSFLDEGCFSFEKNGWKSISSSKVPSYARYKHSQTDYRQLRRRKHVFLLDPFQLLLKNNINITYKIAVERRIALGINPQIIFSDFSTKAGVAIVTDFYSKVVYHGWHIPIYLGIIPARIEFSSTDYSNDGSKTFSDAVHLFIIGTGVGYNWCFKNGFVISPSAGIVYAEFFTDPTKAFKTKVTEETGEHYKEFAKSVPSIFIGIGCTIGWAF